MTNGGSDHAQELILKNELYATSFDKGHLPSPPSKKLVVGKHIPWIELSNYYDYFLNLFLFLVTCMDARIEYVTFCQVSVILVL